MKRGAESGYRAGVGVLLALLLGLGLYGAGGPFVWGHYGYHAGEYSSRARHTLRHHTILPSNAPGYTVPDNASYYLHHPILTHQLVTLTLLVFGQRPIAVRAAGLLSASASLLLLLAILRRYWGRWQALLGGTLFVLVPIHVWFAPHIDPGMPGIACVLGLLFCYLRWQESASWCFGVAAAGLLMLAGLFEWSPYLATLPVALHALYIGVQKRGRWLGFFALLAIGGLLPLLLHAAIVIGNQHLPEMRESYALRSGGPGPWATLLGIAQGARELFSVPLLIALAGWLLLLLRRTFARPLKLVPRDLLPLSFACALVIYIVLLRQGVLAHLYRLLYGGVLCAVAAVEVVEALRVELIRRNLTARIQQIWIGGLSIAIVASTAPFSVLALHESRLHGGVPLAQKYDPGLRPRAFLQRVLSLTSPTDRVYDHPSFIIRKDLMFDLDRNVIPFPSLDWLMMQPAAERQSAVVLLIEPLPIATEQAKLLALSRRYPTWRVYEYTLLDLRQPLPVTTDRPPENRERLLPPSPRSLLRRYWEGPYQSPQLAPQLAPLSR